jgi:hypothetical protein
MAVGTVSSVGGEQWQLISSQTPSTTSVTLTSFSGYKTIMVVGKGVTKSGSEYPKILVNGSTTAGNYATLWGSGGNVGFLCQGALASAQGFVFRIYDCDKATIHKVDSAYDGSGAHGQPTDAYVDPVAVTSLVLTTNAGTATFTGGTVYVYGIAV